MAACVKNLTLGALAICECKRNHHSAKGRHEMRRMIILAAIAVIVATTAIWSVAMFAKPKVVGDLQTTDTRPQISPHEMMIKQGKLLPVEYWAHPF